MEQEKTAQTEDLNDTKDYRNPKFVNNSLFLQYFSSLSTQYQKNWALAAAVHYCALQPAQTALQKGANIKTKVEFVRNFPDYHSVDQWMFLNDENWTRLAENNDGLLSSSDSHYLPLQHPKTDPDCDCIDRARSQEKTTIELMASKCGAAFKQNLLEMQ